MAHLILTSSKVLRPMSIAIFIVDMIGRHQQYSDHQRCRCSIWSKRKAKISSKLAKDFGEKRVQEWPLNWQKTNKNKNTKNIL